MRWLVILIALAVLIAAMVFAWKSLYRWWTKKPIPAQMRAMAYSLFLMAASMAMLVTLGPSELPYKVPGGIALFGLFCLSCSFPSRTAPQDET